MEKIATAKATCFSTSTVARDRIRPLDLPNWLQTRQFRACRPTGANERAVHRVRPKRCIWVTDRHLCGRRRRLRLSALHSPCFRTATVQRQNKRCCGFRFRNYLIICMTHVVTRPAAAKNPRVTWEVRLLYNFIFICLCSPLHTHTHTHTCTVRGKVYVVAATNFLARPPPEKGTDSAASYIRALFHWGNAIAVWPDGHVLRSPHRH